MNAVTITGRLTADVDLKTTTQGVFVCNFTVAVKRPKIKDVTDFIPCVAWRNNAEFISKYFSKGSGIEIKGCITSRKYQDKDGKNHYRIELDVDDAGFPPNTQNTSVAPTGTETPTFEELSAGDDLPF